MEESILNSIKKMLGLDSEYAPFDIDVTIHINAALMVLHQLGVGTRTPFRITGKTEKWKDFLGTDVDFQAAQTYVYLKTKQVFDPPSIGVVSNSLEALIREYEWRLNIQAEGSEATNDNSTL